MKEEWKDIPNYDGYYQVSNYGNIKSLNRVIMRKDNKPYTQKEKILKPAKNNKGYNICVLTKNMKSKTFSIHRLVAEAFIPNPKNLPQVNHKDGNKQNNRVDNLEWITNYDNIQHSIRTGIRKIDKIIKAMNDKVKIPVNQYNKNGKFIRKWQSIKEAELELHIPNQNICKVCQGKRKTAGGYHWKYINKY